LIRRGIFVVPGGKMYLSLVHSDADIDTTLQVFEDALRLSRTIERGEGLRRRGRTS